MKIYLASRYSRREELLRYSQELEALGHIITSRWLTGNHELADRDDYLTAAQQADRERFASEDWSDVKAADCVISFTEEPRGTTSRGGRHVEFGGALMAGKRTVVVGHRENVFHCLPEVEFYPTWLDCIIGLTIFVDEAE